jgi:paraquat-inducible protein B
MKHPALLGAFVLGAIALLLAAAFAVGGAALFERKVPCIAYFDENISGLDVGAPVEYQGVKIGTVTDIHLECNTDTRQFFRPVRFQLSDRRVRYTGTNAISGSPTAALDLLVRTHGLRAQLTSQSLLTGKQKITLAHDPDSEIRLVERNDDNDCYEIPTIPTPLRNAAQKLADLPLAEILADIRSSLAGVSKIVNSPQIAESLEHANETLAEAKVAMERLSATLATVKKRLPGLLDAATGAATSAGTAADSLAGTLSPSSPQSAQLADTLAEIQDTAHSLRQLLDFLEEHPDALLRGRNTD